jgi:hypothetical protein
VEKEIEIPDEFYPGLVKKEFVKKIIKRLV